MGCPPRRIELQTPKARVLLLAFSWLLVPAGQNGLACSDDQHPLSCTVILAGLLGLVPTDQSCTRLSSLIFMRLPFLYTNRQDVTPPQPILRWPHHSASNAPRGEHVYRTQLFDTISFHKNTQQIALYPILLAILTLGLWLSHFDATTSHWTTLHTSPSSDTPDIWWPTLQSKSWAATLSACQVDYPDCYLCTVGFGRMLPGCLYLNDVDSGRLSLWRLKISRAGLWVSIN